MKWIGLTGGIASGKTTVANIFRELGVPVVDADRLAHSALNRNKDKVATYFGRDVLTDAGEIDRRKLGEKVFGDPKLLKSLESMLHPYVQQKAQEKRQLLQSAGEKLAIYDVPLLFEKQLQDQFDEIVLVYAPQTLSKKRLIDRNQLTEKEADDRLNSQMSIEKKKELADVVISNEGDLDDLKNNVLAYFKGK